MLGINTSQVLVNIISKNQEMLVNPNFNHFKVRKRKFYKELKTIKYLALEDTTIIVVFV